MLYCTTLAIRFPSSNITVSDVLFAIIMSTFLLTMFGNPGDISKFNSFKYLDETISILPCIQVY